MKKKYTLTFFVKSDGKEILEKVNCDQWVEIIEGTNPIIYCLYGDKAVGYPTLNLRRVVQNHGVLSSCESNIIDVVGGYA